MQDKNKGRRFLITPGEPAGIGPDILIKSAQEKWDVELIAISDPHLLSDRAKQINLPLEIIEADLNQSPTTHIPGKLKVIPVQLKTAITPGKLDVKNAAYVLQTLNLAAELCVAKKADALITGPVHKGIINDSGVTFSGHTEFFAQYCHVKRTIMLFVIDQLKIALATTHLPLSKVSETISQKLLHETITILNDELQRWFKLETPRILVCGLNPHAGENGHLGREEIDIIEPAIAELRKKNINVRGPLPADTIFTGHHLKEADAILAMYHDQALPLVKYLGFDRAVNVTLGLPFLRTSVDHGTALDVAGTTASNAGSMIAAIKLALELR